MIAKSPARYGRAVYTVQARYEVPNDEPVIIESFQVMPGEDPRRSFRQVNKRLLKMQQIASSGVTAREIRRINKAFGPVLPQIEPAQ